MRVDGVADVGGLAAHFDRKSKLSDQVARVHADDARADDATGDFVEDQLGESLGTANADRPARCGPWELADADLQALGLRLGLGDADPRDFGIGVGDRRNHPRGPFTLFARRDFCRELALVRGLVREHRIADQVADREDVRHVRAHLPVHRNETALADVDASLCRVELAAVRRAAYCDQHAVEHGRRNGFAFLAIDSFERRRQSFLRCLDLRDFRLQMDRDALLLHAVGKRLHQVRIGTRHQLVHQLDDGHFAAECAVHRRHFQADDAAADDQQLFRDVDQIQRVSGIHHARVVPREARQLQRLRARRDDALPEAHELDAVAASNLDLVR